MDGDELTTADYDPQATTAGLLQVYSDPQVMQGHEGLSDLNGAQSDPIHRIMVDGKERFSASGLGRFAGDATAADYARRAGYLYKQHMLEYFPDQADRIEAARPRFEEAVKQATRQYALKKLANEYQGEGGTGTANYWRQQLPFLGGVASHIQDTDRTEAVKAFEAGKADDTHYESLGRALAAEQADRERSIGGNALRGFVGIGKFATEAAAAGSLVPGAGWGGALAQRLGVTSRLGLASAEGLATGARITAGMAPQQVASDIFAGRTASEAGKDQFNRLIDNSLFSATGVLGQKAASGLVGRAKQYAWNSAKLMATGELSQDAKAVLGTGERGPLSKIIDPRTSKEARAQAMDDFIVQGGGILLFEGAMQVLRSGKRATPEALSKELMQRLPPEMVHGMGDVAEPPIAQEPAPPKEVPQGLPPSTAGSADPAESNPAQPPEPTPQERLDQLTQQHQEAVKRQYAAQDEFQRAQRLTWEPNGRQRLRDARQEAKEAKSAMKGLERQLDEARTAVYAQKPPEPPPVAETTASNAPGTPISPEGGLEPAPKPPAVPLSPMERMRQKQAQQGDVKAPEQPTQAPREIKEPDASPEAVGLLKSAGEQAKALRERLSKFAEEKPPEQPEPGKEEVYKDWRQRVVRYHADRYLKQATEAFEKPTHESLTALADSLTQLHKMARARGIDPRKMIENELPEFAKLIDSHADLVDQWLNNPEALPHSEEVKDARPLANEPEAIRRAAVAHLQSAHEAVRAAAQAQDALQRPPEQGPNGNPSAGALPQAPGNGLKWNRDRLSQNEWLRLNNRLTHPYEREALRLKNQGADTLYSEIRKQGGIRMTDAVKDHGLQDFEDLPSGLFKGKKSANTLDEWASHYGLTTDELVAKLKAHHLVEANGYVEQELHRAEADHYAEQERLAQALRDENPEAPEALVRAESDSLARQAQADGRQSGEAEGARGPAAEQLQQEHDAIQEQREAEAGNVGGATGADTAVPGVPFRREPTPGEPAAGRIPRGEPGGMTEGMGAAGGQSESPPPPPGTPTATAPEVPEPGAAKNAGTKPWYQKAADFFKSLAQQSYPALTRLSPSSGEKLARASNARAAAEKAWNYFSRILKVGGVHLGDMSPEEQRFAGSVWLERRMRTYRNALQLAGDADGAKEVGTLIGAEGSPLATEADYQRGREALWSFWEGVKQEWTPEVEKNYRNIMGLEPDEEINAKSQIDKLPLNAIAIRPEDVTRQGKPANGQSLSNIRIRKPGFTRTAELNGDAYDINLAHMMKRTLETGIQAATRADFVRTAIDEGIIKRVPKGEFAPEGWRPLELKPSAGLAELPPGERYYAHPDAYRDIVQGLGIGETAAQQLGATEQKGVVGRFVQVSLLTPAELMTHLGKNMPTALFQEGMGIPGLNAATWLKNAWDIYKKEPVILGKLKGLAEISAAFESRRPTGVLGENLQKVDPTYYVNKFSTGLIDVMQDAMRVQLGDAYDRMASAGKKPSSEGAKRDFINQALGNYNGNASNRIIQAVKQLGLQPFATAASTFTTQGVRHGLGGAVNAPYTSASESVQGRALQLAKLLPILAVGPMYNLLRWGDAFPSGVPAFAAQTSKDDKKTGYIDPLEWPGIRRGWRATGINAAIEGSREGQAAGTIADRAVKDVGHSAEHLVAGPLAEFFHILTTGENLYGYRVAERVSTAKTSSGSARAERKGIPPPGSSQTWQNLKAALANVSSLGHAVLPQTRKEQAKPFTERVTPLLGPFQEKHKNLKRR